MYRTSIIGGLHTTSAVLYTLRNGLINDDPVSVTGDHTCTICMVGKAAHALYARQVKKLGIRTYAEKVGAAPVPRSWLDALLHAPIEQRYRCHSRPSQSLMIYNGIKRCDKWQTNIHVRQSPHCWACALQYAMTRQSSCHLRYDVCMCRLTPAMHATDMWFQL